MRPSLLPNLRPLWRGPHTVQLGTDPARAVVLEFEDLSSIRVLDLLDGSRTAAEVLDEAAALGIANSEAQTILRTLQAAGLVVDIGSLIPAGLPEPIRGRLLVEATALVGYQRSDLAAYQRSADLVAPATRASVTGESVTGAAMTGIARVWQSDPRARARTPAEAMLRRRAAKVLVMGSEALVAPIIITLAGAGVGHVYPWVDGRSDAGDLISAITRAAPETLVTRLRAGAATVLVRVGVRAPAVPTGRGRRAAVLDVTIRDGAVLIGPLVRPAGSPCGRCLELHRKDRDPGWPVLAAQLATAQVGTDGCPLTTALSAAALAADEVLTYLDGRSPRTDGAAIELRRPGEARRRSWSPHPRCDCRRRRPLCNGG